MTLLLRVVVLSTLVSCAEGPVRRVVPLVAEDGLPLALTTLTGASMQLNVSRLEALQAEHRLYAWTRGAAGWAKVNEVALGANTLTGPAWASVEELIISEESGPLGTAPARVLFRGPLGTSLPFAGADFDALQHATLEAVLEDFTLTMHVKSLPALMPGAFYGVWLIGAGEAPELTLLGALAGDDTELIGDELLGAHHEVLLTLELEDGPETMGSPLMRGLVLDPHASTTVAAPELTHQH